MAWFGSGAPPELEQAFGQYLRAAHPLAVERLADQISQHAAVVFPRWFDALLPELRRHTEDYFVEVGKLPHGEDPLFEAEIHRWNALGVRAGLAGQFELGRALYEQLLEVLRAAQQTTGRISKSTAYHQLGWLRLLEDGASQRARPYFLLAAIEDMLSGVEPEERTPAFEVLRSTYKFSHAALYRLRERLTAGETLPSVRFGQNPELFLLQLGTFEVAGQEPEQ